MRAYVHVRRWGADGDGLDPLINRIARNLLIDRHRRAAPHLVPLDAAGEVHDPAEDPDEQVLRRQRNFELRSAVSELPERHRTAIMYSLKGMTPAEVADKLGIGRNAADALLHRARRSLRERLRHVGDGMLGFGFWLGNKARGGARRAGLDGHFAFGGVAVESGSALVAAAALAVVAAFGGVPGGTNHGRRVAASPAYVADVAAVLSPAATGSIAADSGQVPSQRPHEVALGPASAGAAGPDGRGNYFRGGGSVTDPHDPSREVLGFGPSVYRQDDEGTLTAAAERVCSQADDCSILFEDPRP